MLAVIVVAMCGTGGRPAGAQMAAVDGPAGVGGTKGPAAEARGEESDSLPEQPVPQSGAGGTSATSATISAEHGAPQTKRILGIVPNFRSVSAGATLPPQTVREKFSDAMADSFDYSAFVFVGIQAGANMASASTPEFHQGAAGFARYYWHTFVDQADENLWVEAILPSALHDDTRYYTLGHGGVLRRAEYAVTRIVVTKTDAGGMTANVPELLGSGMAAAIGSMYYPGDERTWTKVGQRWLTNAILDGATFGVKEFWPDVNRAVFHTR